jgi:hypothetical protein
MRFKYPSGATVLSSLSGMVESIVNSGFDQGNRILIALFSRENAFQNVVTPSCLESLASNGALFY